MEAAVAFAAANRAALSTMAALAPTPDLSTLQLVSHKGLLAHFLAEHGLPGPPTVLYTPDTGFFERVASLHFPVMLKPATARGGRDIRRFETLAELRAFCQVNGPFAEPYIVQSFIKGYDIDCSVLCQDGRVLADPLPTLMRGLAGATRWLPLSRGHAPGRSAARGTSRPHPLPLSRDQWGG